MKDSLKKFYKELKNDIYHLNKNINYIHGISGKSSLIIFFDIIYSFIRYGITDNEYRIFEFYKIKHDKRKTYLSISKHNRYAWFIENKDEEILNDKKSLNKKFSKYLNREVYEINKMTFKEFEDFALDTKKIIARSSKANFSKSFKVYNISDFRSPAFVADEIKKSKLDLIEKNIFTNKQLSKINSDLVIINIVTLDGDLVSSSIKFKVSNKIISGYVDIKSHEIKGNLKDEDGNNYSNEFDKFKIPKFDEIIKLLHTLSEELKSVREIEWSFGINNKGNVYFMDANKWEDFVFAQTPEFLNSRVGLLPKYKKHISIWRNI